MIKQLSHICFFTNDLNKVKKFYINILKFKISHKFINKTTKEEYGLYINCGNKTFLEVFKIKKKLNLDRNFTFHVCFNVNDIKNLQKKISKINKKTTKLVYGKTDKILQFKTFDYEGNLIEFHQQSTH